MDATDRVVAPRLSFGSWAFAFGPFASAPWSFDRVCRYLADAGYDGVELNGFRPHPHHRDGESMRRSVRELLDELELGVSAYAPDFTSVPPGEASEAAYLDEIDAALGWCRALDAPLLRVDSVSPPDRRRTRGDDARLVRLVKTWRAAAARCADAGVQLVWEFEPGFWLNRPSEVLRVVEDVASPAFKLLFDTSHAYMGGVVGARHGDEPETLQGGVVEYAQLLRPHVGHLHLINSDGSLHDNETSAHIPFGQGRVDFPAVLGALRPTLDELEWWGIDFCFCPTTELDGRAAVPFVRSLTTGLVNTR